MCYIYCGWRDVRAHAIDPPIFKQMSQLLLRWIEVVAASNLEHYTE